MFEIQLHGVKCEPPDRIRASAVCLVSDDGMAALGEMNADLVLSSRFQLYLDEGCARGSSQNFHVRHSMLSDSGVVRRVDAIGGVFCEVGPHSKRILLNTPLDNRHVPPSGTVVLELIL